MKLLFKKILVFIFPLFLLVVGMDFYLRNMNSLYKEKVRGLIAHAHEIEILILGNSHAGRGVDPNYFTDYTFNIANVGQSIYFDKELTLKNLKYLENLKYVFISLNYHSLYFSSQRGNRNIWSYYGNGIKYSSTSYYKADISPFLFGYGPRVSFSYLKKDILAKVGINPDEVVAMGTAIQGYVALSGTETNDFNNNSYTDRINGFNKLIKTSTEKKIVMNELNQLITTLKERSITPIFLSTPTFKEYNIKLDSNIINKNLIDAENLCKKYNIEFWDYAINNNFVQYEFFNPDHLNKKGAERFSKMLDERLKLYNN